MSSILQSSALLLFVAFFLGKTGFAQPVVTTKCGKIRGQLVQVFSPTTQETIEVYQFTGIPFATPPIGRHRFRKPVPVHPWESTGVLDATRLPPSCTPNVPPSGKAPGNFGSEDCLYLNVWVPRTVFEARTRNKTTQLASVFVFIQGGSFLVAGSKKDNTFDGTYLAALNDIVVATIQYRIGSLGFAYLANEEVPGNMGLWDQLEAFSWISENIAAFGGNSSDVTIAGQSLGAVSVSLHLLSPYSRKYFHRAIIQSGTAISPWGVNSPEVATTATNMVFQEVCNQSQYLQAQLVCLRSVPAPKFPELDEKPTSQIFEHVLHPVVDGDFIPYDPMKMLLSGDYYRVPILVGANKNEGTIFVAPTKLGETLLPTFEHPNRSLHDLTYEHYSALMNDRFGQHGGEKQVGSKTSPLLMDAIQLHYWPRTHEGNPKGPEVFQAVADAQGDYGIVCPTYVWANITATNGGRVFAYQFSQRYSNRHSPEFMGVMHGDELPFVFGQPFAKPAIGRPVFTDPERQLSLRMMTYWANFVKFGNPNGAAPAPGKPKLRHWPNYSEPQCVSQYFDLNALTNAKDNENDTNVGVICGLRNRDCLFWHDHIAKLANKLAEPPAQRIPVQIPSLSQFNGQPPTTAAVPVLTNNDINVQIPYLPPISPPWSRGPPPPDMRPPMSWEMPPSGMMMRPPPMWTNDLIIGTPAPAPPAIWSNPFALSPQWPWSYEYAETWPDPRLQMYARMPRMVRNGNVMGW